MRIRRSPYREPNVGTVQQMLAAVAIPERLALVIESSAWSVASEFVMSGGSCRHLRAARAEVARVRDRDLAGGPALVAGR